MEFFPFKSMRPGQDLFFSDVKDTTLVGKHLIAHAPTGLGKTAAVLGACLKFAIEEEKTVFFLTPRHSQHNLIIETIKKIKEKTGIKLPCVDIIGKKWFCPVKGTEFLSNSEFSEFCRQLKEDEKCGYYNKVWNKLKLEDEVEEVLKRASSKSPLHAEELRQECKNYCVHEIAILLGKKARVIIADYYHLFSPYVRNALLMKLKKNLEDAIIIVDEAHNLGARIRGLLTTKISNFSLVKSVNEARDFNEEGLANLIIGVIDSLEKLALLLKNKEEIYVLERDLSELLENEIGDVDDFIARLKTVSLKVIKEKKKSSLSSLANFLEFWKSEQTKSDAFTRIIKKAVTKRGNRLIELSINCLDPSILSGEVFRDSFSSVLMSGTLTPQNMYRDILGLEKERTVMKTYSSPFPKKNRLVLIVPDSTTKYSRRTEKEFEKIASYCKNIINNCPSNLAIFFPSYDLRDTVIKKVSNVSKKIIVEKKGMNKAEKSSLIEEFKRNSPCVLAGCVSGNFAEGLDYPGKDLECVVIIGIPLGTPNLKTNALIKYYDKKFHRGWDYGYIFPAMNRTVQAAGRCIRSEHDRGVIILIDERYVWKNYLKCIPPEWTTKVTKSPQVLLRGFLGN